MDLATARELVIEKPKEEDIVSADTDETVEIDSARPSNSEVEERYRKMETIRKSLNRKNAKIHEKEDTIISCKKALETYTGVWKLFKHKEIEELQNKVSNCEMDIKKLKAELSQILMDNGYKNAREFYLEYNQVKKARNQQIDGSCDRNTEITASPTAKEGIHKRLKEKREKSAQQSQKKTSERKRTSIEL